MEIKSFASEIDKFLDNLERLERSKVAKMLDLLEFSGSDIGMPYSKSLGNGLFELRISGKVQVRIIYCFYQKHIILLNTFIKKQSKIPKKEIDLAQTRKNMLA